MEPEYNAKLVESKWSSFWEENQFFKANPNSKKSSFSVVMPPPNVTGVLHMGHALDSTLQDILTRWHRMCGYESLWVPGTDHAGIATQTVVERHLLATEGKKRSDYSREDFLNIVWQWKERHEKAILDQLKKMGCSCDFSRLRFTMDEGCNLAVRRAFKSLFDEKLIYRSNYLVNWDPLTQTALADDEVEYEERSSNLWFFRYHLTDGSGYINVATTRPETMLGDTAVAVSPQDDRYRDMIGKHVHLPLSKRTIPIISDYRVDPKFGSGAVKITPAHDQNDYLMGLEHSLPSINILTPDGFINENGGHFKGLSREEARLAVVKEMQSLGLVDKIEPYTLRVGVSYRSKAIIEPYLSKQWFIKMGPFIQILNDAIKNGEVKIIPKTWEHTYFHWVDNLRDWCISRQLWWGHRIPVWYRKDDPEIMVCSGDLEVPNEVKIEPDLWEQDPDVLDTWFSSALWPFSTLGWPNDPNTLEKFYPTSVLITGHDIIFFWVARMIMMGKKILNKKPFSEVFLHGLIYGKSYWRNRAQGGIAYVSEKEKNEYDLGKPLPKDVFSKWEKLSKSKGNVIDPLKMIADYGTDAVRMSLCACANQSPQIDLDLRRFEEFKNFANKVWNGARFVLMNIEGFSPKMLSAGIDKKLLSLEDLWILSTLNRVNGEVNNHLKEYSFDQATSKAYSFFWNEFCAYYLEIVKPYLFGKIGSNEQKINKQRILVIVLVNILRLLHPMAPFITEDIFQKIKELFLGIEKVSSDPYTEDTVEALLSPACTVASYPQVICDSDRNLSVEKEFSLIEKILYSIRQIRGEVKIPLKEAIDVYIVGRRVENLYIIQALTNINSIQCVDVAPNIYPVATGAAEDMMIYIPITDEQKQKEQFRLEKELEKLQKNCERLENLLTNQDFLSKADPILIGKQKELLMQSRASYNEIQAKIGR